MARSPLRQAFLRSFGRELGRGLAWLALAALAGGVMALWRGLTVVF
jgi:hypothetical protein